MPLRILGVPVDLGAHVTEKVLLALASMLAFFGVKKKDKIDQKNDVISA